MENKVGDNAPSTVTFAGFLTTLQTMERAFKVFCIVLNKTERTKLLHARKGCEPHVARVHDLSKSNGVSIENIPLAGMLADLALFTALRPIGDALRSLLQMVDDTTGEAESEAWTAYLAYYGALTGIAKHNATLKAALKPTIDFMATGPRKVPGEPETPEGSE